MIVEKTHRHIHFSTRKFGKFMGGGKFAVDFKLNDYETNLISSFSTSTRFNYVLRSKYPSATQ